MQVLLPPPRRRQHRAGRNRIHPNARSKVQRSNLRELGQRLFGEYVRNAFGIEARDPPVHQIDDRALLHPLRKRTREQHGNKQVRPEFLPDLRRRHAGHRVLMKDGGIVDENVQPAGRLHDRRDQTVARRFGFEPRLNRHASEILRKRHRFFAG